MAFETFLTVDKMRPRRGRRLTFAISLGVHAVLLVVGVVSSFASVDEIKPPAGTHIVFGQLPAPPPPPAGGGRPKPNPTHRRFVPSKLHAPTDIRAPHDKQDDPPDVGPPSTTSDEIGGGNQPCDGCVGDQHQEETRFLAPSVTAGRMATDPQAEQYRPHLPPALARAGMIVSVLMKLCTDRDGNIVDVKVLRASDPAAVDSVVTAARSWRYTPYKVEGRAVPFCTTVNYQVRTN